MVEACMRLMVIPSFLFANLLIVIADPLIALLYGPKFAGAERCWKFSACIYCWAR